MNLDYIRQVGPLRWAVRYGTYQFRKRVLRRSTRYQLPTGTPLILPIESGYSGSVYVTKARVDWGAEALLAELADPMRDFLDVGSHFGYYANYLSPRVRRVFAFEPDPRNLPHLRANAALVGNVEVLPLAVSSRDGRAPLHVGSLSCVSSLEGSGPAVEVQTTTIDTFVFNSPGVEVTVVKTDIEGHDLEALRGMERTVQRDRPVVLTECSYSDNLAALCDRWGYSLYAFTRTRPNIRRVRLERINERNRGAWFEMLFLVPRTRIEAFEARWSRRFA